MPEIIINGEHFYLMKDAAKLTNLSESSLTVYLHQKRFPELDSFTEKVGATRVISQSGIDFLNNKVNRIQGKEKITLGGIEFPSKSEAAEYFGFPPEDLSRYLRVKKLVEGDN